MSAEMVKLLRNRSSLRKPVVAPWAKPQNRFVWFSFLCHHYTTWGVFSSWPPGHLTSAVPPTPAEPDRTPPNRNRTYHNKKFAIFFLPPFWPPHHAKPH